MELLSIDHLVLVVADVEKTCAFYQRVLGMEPRKDSAGRWGLYFGKHKISLQQQGNVPKIAERTRPGSGNFCVLTATPLDQVAAHLKLCKVEIIAGPSRKEGAQGPILSVYFHDLDGNLVEVANPIKI